MKIAVVGSRNFSDFELLKDTLNQYDNIIKIVSGGARGADSLAEKYAKLYHISTEIYKPDWKKYGRRAGFKRNTDIIINADQVIAFWDGRSLGTNNSINLCTRYAKPVKIIKYGENIGLQNIF